MTILSPMYMLIRLWLFGFRELPTDPCPFLRETAILLVLDQGIRA